MGDSATSITCTGFSSVPSLGRAPHPGKGGGISFTRLKLYIMEVKENFVSKECGTIDGCEGDSLQPKFFLTLKKLVIVFHCQLCRVLITHMVTNTSR